MEVLVRSIDEIRLLDHVLGCLEEPPGLTSTLVIVVDLPLPGDEGHYAGEFAMLKSGITRSLQAAKPAEYLTIELEYQGRRIAL
jgi:hypothetical protein